jgi:hypothetical protein
MATQEGTSSWNLPVVGEDTGKLGGLATTSRPSRPY